MIGKHRLIRIALIALAVLGVAGYGAFSTFLFNPLEGRLGVDVAGLVERDVDFFLARAELRRTFDDFPRLRVEEELRENRAWRMFASSPEKEELWAELGIPEIEAELGALAQQLPLGYGPLDLFGGRDLALAGRFNGSELAQADWAAYGSLNWAGKLFLEGVRYPSLIGLSKQGIDVEVGDDWVRLSGGQMARELFLGRIKDVGIVATSAAPILAAKTRHERQYEDSMLLRAEYGDHVLTKARSAAGDEFELWIDFRELFENLKLSGAWPDQKSESVLAALFGRYFQANLLNYLVGYMGLDEGLTLDLRGQLSSELMSPLQQRAYYRSSADRAELRNVAAIMAPADAGLFVYLRSNIGDFLRQLLDSMDKATRDLLEEAFRATNKYRDLNQVVDVLDSCLRDRLAIIVRPNDYPKDPDGPPHDDTAVPSIAIVTWLRDGKKSELEAFRDVIGHNHHVFGLVGRKDGEPGYYQHSEGGYETREFWNPLIPGTGVIATVNAADMCVITNSHRMLSHVVRTYTTGGTTMPRLSERGDFEALLSSSIPQASLMVWANPRALGDTLRKMARQAAQNSIFIDWVAERAKAERQIVQERYPEQAAALQRNQLTPEFREQLDVLVAPILDARQREIYEAELPVLLDAYERRIVYAEAASAALALLALDPKRIDLSVRIVAPIKP